MRDKIDYQAYTEAVLFTTPLHTIALIIQAVQTLSLSLVHANLQTRRFAVRLSRLNSLPSCSVHAFSLGQQLLNR